MRIYQSNTGEASGAAKYLKVSTVDVPGYQGQPTFSVGSDANHLVTMGGIYAVVTVSGQHVYDMDNPDSKAISVAIVGGNYDTIELNGCFADSIAIDGSATNHLKTDDMTLYFGAEGNYTINIDVTGVSSDSDVMTMCDSFCSKGYMLSPGVLHANATIDGGQLISGTPSQGTITFTDMPTTGGIAYARPGVGTIVGFIIGSDVLIGDATTPSDVASIVADWINNGGTSGYFTHATVDGATVTVYSSADNADTLSTTDANISITGMGGGVHSSWTLMGV